MFQNGIDNVRHEGKYALTYSLYSPKVFQDIGPLYSPFQRPTPNVDECGIIQNTWEELSLISASRDYTGLSIGDKKEIILSGTMGTAEFTDYSCYAYIIGIDHNAQIEGTGITFNFCIKNTDKNIAFTDSQERNNFTDGRKIFNMNHWGSYTRGGWSGCDTRYDILGSTNVQPSDYGSVTTEGRTGYNPTSTCTTDPIQNTLMSCLPSDLRLVMKLLTKYSNNYGASQNQDTMSISQDYLPLLSLYEVTGDTTAADLYCSIFEKDYQEQYDYFKSMAGVKYSSYKGGYTEDDKTVWWTRSPLASDGVGFCCINTVGNGTYHTTSFSHGISPIFLI